MQRPNLTVRPAHAQRVLLDGTRAYGVAYKHGGFDATVEAEREVLLCGGSFNTPQF